MLSKDQNHVKKQGCTRLAAIRVTEIDDSLEVAYSFIIKVVDSGSVTTLRMVRLRLS